MWPKIKQWCLDQVLWVEHNMQGKSGAEKRKAVIERFDELIKLPSYLEWVDGPLLGWLVDYICEKLNWLTDYKFSNITASEQLMTALETSVAKVSLDKTIEERLTELYHEYNIIGGDNREQVPENPNDTSADDNDINVSTNTQNDAFSDSFVRRNGVTNAPSRTVRTGSDDDFTRALKFTLTQEGEANFTVKDGKPVLKSYAKADKGGPTIYGITQATLKAAYVQGIVSHNDIAKLTLDEAKAIYKKNYWTRYGWGELTWPVCLCCLDCCVNHGGFALILQRALKDRGCTVTIDGKFGPQTFAALKSLNNKATDLAFAIVARRREYFKAIVNNNPSQKVFLKGWLNRCDALAAACKEV